MKPYVLVAAERASSLGVNFLALAILSRFLSPEEFGVVAIVNVFIAVSTVLVDSGLGGALIYEKEIKESDYRTVFTINMIVALGLFAIFFLIAPLVSDIYDNKDFKNLIRLSSLTIVLRAISLTSVVELTKTLKFGYQVVVNLVSSIFGLAAAILLARQEYGAYALVFQQIVTAFLGSVGFLIVVKKIPRLGYSDESFKRLIGFGYRLTASSLLKSFYQSASPSILGLHAPVKTVGFFNQANRLNGFYTSFFHSIVDKVAFPILAKSRNDVDQHVEQITTLIKVTLTLSLYTALVFYFFSDSIVLVALGEGWSSAAEALKTLSLSGPAVMLAGLNRVVLKSNGLSKEILNAELLKAILITGLLLSTAPLGLNAFLYATVIGLYLSFAINLYYVCNRTPFKLADQIRSLFVPFLSFVFMLVFICAFIKVAGYFYAFFATAALGFVLLFFLYWLVKGRP